MTVTSVGLDIGGVNLKITAVSYRSFGDFKVLHSEHTKASPPFFVAEYRRFLREFKGKIDVVGVTSTGELTPGNFVRLEEGIRWFADKVGRYFKGPAYWMSLYGALVENRLVPSRPYDVSAANWVASALLVGRLVRDNCIMVDVGSTTTDIIPVVGGKPRTAGKLDYERLASGELVYTGAVYSNARLVSEVTVSGRKTKTANDYFATMGDVHSILGNMTVGEYERYFEKIAELRDPKNAYARLAHLVCADDRILARETIEDIAEQLYAVQVEEISSALRKVYRKCKRFYLKKPPVVATGFGATFLAAKAAASAGFDDVVFLEDALGEDASLSTPSLAMALLSGEKVRETG